MPLGNHIGRTGRERSLGRRLVLGLSAAALAAGLATAGPAQAGLVDIPSAAPGAPAAADLSAPADGLLVRFDDSAPAGAIERAVASAGGTIEVSHNGGGFARISTGSKSAAAVGAALAASPVVDLVEPNRIRYAGADPNDPRYANQTSYLQTMHLPEAWNSVTGNDAMVLAIIDSGVQLNPPHPDLVGRLVPGYDFVNRDSSPDDDFGHGTMVAGIAAASTNNGVGVAGAAWRGKLMPVKVLDSRGAANDDNIAAGIHYAVDHGADVINLSLGGPGASAVLQDAVDYATVNDVVVIAAAGNDGDTEPHFPAACKGVVAVGAIDNAGNLASFSSRGPWIRVVAPGVSIMTTTRGSGYGLGTGTSFSSPLVAAVAFLLRAADPNATQASIVARLEDSADDLGPGGFDSLFGHGLVNARAALDLTTFSSASSGSGYWMVSTDGRVYSFGGAAYLGSARRALAAGTTAVDLEPTPSNGGYWIVDSAGNVYSYGNAAYLGGLAPGTLGTGEQVTSFSAAPGGAGYWLFTTTGRVFPFGNAGNFGDLRALRLNRPVLDSIPTPNGQGYYMVAADGGIFAFGNARFAGSMGGKPLNAPVQSLVPDPDGSGYWLVASDGGVFAFDAPFRGSTGHLTLNAPVTGMVPFGNAYLMVATDGGVFNFSNLPFAGSLGGSAPAYPIVAVAAKVV
jgi:subtilisin family serine protease